MCACMCVWCMCVCVVHVLVVIDLGGSVGMSIMKEQLVNLSCGEMFCYSVL